MFTIDSQAYDRHRKWTPIQLHETYRMILIICKIFLKSSKNFSKKIRQVTLFDVYTCISDSYIECKIIFILHFLGGKPMICRHLLRNEGMDFHFLCLLMRPLYQLYKKDVCMLHISYLP